MSTEQFEETLREYIRREPFQPFVVELIDGRTIEIPERSVIFNGGAATYITPDFYFVEFVCEETKAIHAAVPETT